MRICFLFFILGIYINGFAQGNKQITLEDIYVKATFRADAVAGFRSMKDGNFYTEIAKDGELQQVRFFDGKVARNIVNLKAIKYDDKLLNVDDYAFNNNETKLILFTESENIFRRSVLYKVYLYDIVNKTVNLVSKDKILHPSFSPQSDKIAYVFENNLYYLDLKDNKTIQVTNDGSYNIINANCDWVYEEEFQFTKAYEWSALGDYLAYYRFDQTLVPEYNFANYDKLYPTDYKYKYPKAGENNSTVQIKTYQLSTAKTTSCNLGEETDIYYPRINIHNYNNKLIVYKLNRLQNQLSLFEVDVLNGESRKIYEENNKCYVEVNDNIRFLEKQNAFIYTSEKDGYNHLYIHQIGHNKSTQLTKGKWDVVAIKGVDESKQTVYYNSSEVSPLERNIYSIQFNGSNKVAITPAKGWHDVEFSNGFDFFMDKYSYLNNPPVFAIYDRNGKEVRVLKDNTSLRNKMKEFDLAKLELIKVPNEEGELLNAWILKPNNFSPEKKYPLLMFQYSGPGSQSVSNQFSQRDMWWNQMLAQKGYIVACVDGTGTGFRGEAFKKKTYLQLGKYESDDQIAAAKYFANQSYIDASRIGIWGWSYGGYMSSICIMKGADVFKSAIAVAPVTNWRYYDNIYTERYMRTPQENANGYDDNSPTTMVNKLKGNFLLIHGTADDNVHYQNSMMLVDELIKANKDFDAEFYPNRNHGISGGVTRFHLYRKMTNFILEKL